MAVLICQMCWSLDLEFIICEFGERASDGFDKLCDETCQLDWYSYPIKVQQMLPDIMIGTQKPVLIRGFGNIQCTRSAFNRVSLRTHNLNRIQVLTRNISNSFSCGMLHFLISRCFASSEIKTTHKVIYVCYAHNNRLVSEIVHFAALV